jgi:hypothetical protein
MGNQLTEGYYDNHGGGKPKDTFSDGIAAALAVVRGSRTIAEAEGILERMVRDVKPSGGGNTQFGGPHGR